VTKERQIKRAKEVFDIEIKGLEATRDSIGGTFTDAVKLILSTLAGGGLVVVTGVGKNLHVAEKMSAIFASTGTRSIVLNPVQAMHGDLGMVTGRDVLVALSFSGESEEVLRLIPAVRRHGLKVISMTGNPKSSLAKLSDIHLAIPCGREACPFGMAPTNSVTATLAMGDALAMVLIDARKFSIEDYAGNHPAGAIGRALVLKVSDIMRTGEALALIPPSATVMEAALAMTASHGGSAIVVDKAGRLKGIFTDGDFRREMAKGSATPSPQILATPVAKVMTKSPSFVFSDDYAADLLKVFERKRIDDLPVCDRKGKVVGIVDLQDLPKMKVL
jgi:arabinose-5-phosphate isomerase